MPAFMRSKNKRAETFEDNSNEASSWLCWQCSFVGNSSDELSFHLETCESIIPPDCSNLSGCPYCPLTEDCHSKNCFNVHTFTEHANQMHSEIEGIICPYCAIEMKPMNLLRLVQHIMFYHKIFWRPSPYSLAHLRVEKIQRDIVCTGCGFTTPQIIETDQVTPPPSFLSHIQICSQNGASICEQKFPSQSTKDCRMLIEKLYLESETITAHFTQRFPFSRGFVDFSNTQLSSLSYMNIKELPESIPELCDVKCPTPFIPNVNLSNEQKSLAFENITNQPKLESIVVNLGDPGVNEQFAYTVEVQSKIEPQPIIESYADSGQNQLLGYTTETGEQILLPTLKEEDDGTLSDQNRAQKAKKNRRAPSLNSNNNGPNVPKVTKFDVPLTMPPEPPNVEVLRKKKNPDGRVFVCPTCGESTFTSLRERDEHMEKIHNGELVFPCQLCGTAYPLYIALRRHAVLKHSAQYEAVLYGLMPENEPNQCPKCGIVAFSDPVVLKMHLAVVHNFDADEKPKKVTKLKTTESEEEYAPTPDEDHSDENRKRSLSVMMKKARPKGRSRGRPSTISTLGTITSRISNTRQDDDELYSPSQSYSRQKRTPRGRRSRGSLMSRGHSSSGRSRYKDPTVYGEKTRYEKFCEKNVNISETEKIDQTLTDLEIKLADVSPSTAPTLCTECHLEVQNHRELLLHNELEHNSAQVERHMGCSVCGRVFFGQHGKYDLIGHLKISHQLQQSNNLTERPFTCSNQQCLGMFTSIRLKSLHQCPIRHLPLHLLQSAQHLSNFLEGMPVSSNVLATELLADQVGCYILAYGCPDCGYIFTGDNATLRYVKHRKEGSCNVLMTTGQ